MCAGLSDVNAAVMADCEILVRVPELGVHEKVTLGFRG